MSKMQWNILKHSSQRPVAGSQEKTRKQSLLHLNWLLATGLWLLCFIVSCAPKIIERPSREGISLPEVLAKMNTVQSIEAVLSIDYEKNDTVMSGDAFLNVSPAALNLRIYYLGFLAGEVKEDNGIIKSKPKLDKYKSVVLVDGLRNSFLWWTITDYIVQENADSYVLRNYYRKLTISKKDLLPVQQIIALDNGEELAISYDSPARCKSETAQTTLDPELAWYQSHLSIRYRNHKVNVTVKSYIASTQKAAALSSSSD